MVFAHGKADSRFSYSSAWLSANGLPLFGLEGCGIFPIVSNGDSTGLLQIMVSRLFLFGSLSRKLASRQVASTIPDSRWLLAGQESALPTQCFLCPHSLTSSRTDNCRQAGKENAVRLNGGVRPLHESALASPKHSWKTKRRICRRCTQTRTYYVKNINKTREKAYRVKLSF